MHVWNHSSGDGAVSLNHSSGDGVVSLNHSSGDGAVSLNTFFRTKFTLRKIHLLTG